MPLDLPLLTADLPGAAGVIRQRPEDFLVEELPLYPPTGAGEHVMLWVEKRRLTTTEAVQRVARAFRVRNQAVGFAGMKDKHAVTRQHLTVHKPGAEAGDEECLQRLDHPPLKLLWAQRHANKLKRGHLRGNRFTILIRQAVPDALERARRILDRLTSAGVPNYLGEQRFGNRGNNHLVAAAMLQARWRDALDLMLGEDSLDAPWAEEGRLAYLRRDYVAALKVWDHRLRHERQALDALRQGRDDRAAVLAIDPFQRSFFLSSFQGQVFNQVLARRLEMGSFDRLLPGDLACFADSRSIFPVDEDSAQQDNAPGGRVTTLDVSPSGPMVGEGMPWAQGLPGEIEREALERTGVTQAQLASGEAGHAEGSRRPLRIRLQVHAVEEASDDRGPHLRVAFDLPRGSFATVVLREVMKNEAGAAPTPEE